MASFSNKSLVLMGVVVLAFSIFGSIYSLDLLDKISTTGYVPTGTGAINLTVGATISINVTDSVIDFGNCTVLGSPSVFDSGQDDTALDNNNCTAAAAGFPDNISINNDGNVAVNVTAAISSLPQTAFTGGTAAQTRLSLRMANDTAAPGCYGSGVLTAYEGVGNFTTAGAPGALDLCYNLGSGDGNDTMVVFAKYWLYQGVSGEADLTVTFTADQV